MRRKHFGTRQKKMGRRDIPPARHASLLHRNADQ
jgi:hypothetical protein